MGLTEIVEKVTDPYERQARLWPALLTLLPLLAMLSVLYGPMMSTFTALLGLAGSCGMLYALANIARELGKRLEPKLYTSWGGKPTTQLLRHRNSTIEGVTKRRYHSFLSRVLNEPFPSSEEEQKDSIKADETYQSGVRWLLNQTRNTEIFALLFKENITYGFRRNALGLKPIGLAISFLTVIWLLMYYRVLNQSNHYFIDINAMSDLPATVIILMCFLLFMIAIWILFFSKATTKNAAFTYAETLLRSCDILDKKGEK